MPNFAISLACETCAGPTLYYGCHFTSCHYQCGGVE